MPKQHGLPFQGTQLEVDYLLAARAALRAGAFCSALLYAEWWAEDYYACPAAALQGELGDSDGAGEHGDGLGGASGPRPSAEDKAELRAVLIEVYTNLGDQDSVRALRATSGASELLVGAAPNLQAGEGDSGQYQLLAKCDAMLHSATVSQHLLHFHTDGGGLGLGPGQGSGQGLVQARGTGGLEVLRAAAAFSLHQLGLHHVLGSYLMTGECCPKPIPEWNQMLASQGRARCQPKINT